MNPAFKNINSFFSSWGFWSFLLQMSEVAKYEFLAVLKCNFQVLSGTVKPYVTLGSWSVFGYIESCKHQFELKMMILIRFTNTFLPFYWLYTGVGKQPLYLSYWTELCNSTDSSSTGQLIQAWWPSLPEPGSTRCFFLLKGSYSSPLSPKCLLIWRHMIFGLFSVCIIVGSSLQ